jgi:hypothetical protein
MSGLNSKERRQAAAICDDQQRKLYENAGAPYPGRICEVTRAREFGDAEYLKEKWTEGDCSTQLIVDHIDNNPDNNPTDGSNFQWLCRCHNLKKNPPADAFRNAKFSNNNVLKHSLREGGGREKGGERKNQKENEFWNGGDVLIVRNMEMAKNITCKPIFQMSVKKIMRRVKEASWSDLVEAAVQETKAILHNGNELSIVIGTGEKWLKPMTADLSGTAPFYVEKRGGEKIVKWKKEPKRKSRKAEKAQ